MQGGEPQAAKDHAVHSVAPQLGIFLPVRPVFALGLKVLVVLALAWGLFVFISWRFQERIAFPGPDTPVPDPSRFGAPDGEVVTVETTDGVTLKGWYLPPSPASASGERAAGLIWFYGNLETVANVGLILHAYDLRPPGMGLLVLDYRGYGSSGGRTTEAGLYRDADAAWRHLTGRPQIDSTRIAVYGRSLGSAVALYLATTYPVRAVVLDSPFSTGHDMAEEHYGLVPTELLRLKLDNLARAREMDAPLLVFHGDEDLIAPLPMGRSVAAAGDAEELIVIRGAGHNNTYDVAGDRYRRRMHEFLRRHLAAPAEREE